MIAPGLGAFLIIVNTLSAKLYMSFGVRLPEGRMNEDQKRKYWGPGGGAENASRAQLNEAEYSGLLFALLIYLHMAKVRARARVHACARARVHMRACAYTHACM